MTTFRRFRSLCLQIPLLAYALLPQVPTFDDLPKDVQAVLRAPDRVEMLYLGPDPETGKGMPRAGRWPIAEAIPVPEDKKETAIFWLRGLYDPRAGGSRCFEPHHALRLRKGEEVFDFVVCLGCGGTKVFHGKEEVAYLPTRGGSEHVPEKAMPFLPGHPLDRKEF